MKTTASIGRLMATLLLAACGTEAGDDAGPDARFVVDAGSGTDAGPAGDADAGRRDAGVRLEPGSPGASDVQVEVDTFADVHAISPLIYGVNGGTESTPNPEHYTFFRSGGNRMTAYNWENNASNAGADYFHQNDALLGGGDTPGEVPRSFVADTIARGVSLVTIPIIGYVAADKRGDGDVNATPDFLNTRFRRSHARDPSGPSVIPVTDDGEVYQDGMVQLLENRFSSMRAGEHRGVHYSLDNEPDLWAATHPRLRGGDGSLALTYEELWSRTVEYASMVREVAPNALIYGPVSYGFNGYVGLQDAPDRAGRDFLGDYLDRLREHETSTGVRLVDVLDLHWYPEIDVRGMPIESDANDADVAYWRMQAARSLFDETFEEPGWIGDYLGEPIRLLPRIRAKIDTHFPGMRLAITEYYYGGGDHISGGIAQADVLGAFGREGVFAAARWHLGSTDDRFIHGAVTLLRGDGHRFGDVSVRATTSDLEASGAYASVRSDSSARVVVLLLNKTDAPLDAGVRIAHGVVLGDARIVRLDASSAEPGDAGTVSPSAQNAYLYTMPAFSASILVLDPAD